MIHLSEQIKLIEHDRIIDKSHGQHTCIEETMKSSQPKFYANALLLSKALSCEHYVSMYLGEYPVKLWLSVKYHLVTKNTLAP